ncbi:unnamed protein product [Ilex paraguariensis]|uniref:LisH domain-containing protein n=1 Tax=Ilex paraguariensis TaxID=185542 RepID=A0ABC8QW10_9AQUA
MEQQANPEGPITAAERSRIWSKLHSGHDTFIEKQATEKVERNFSLEIRKATSKNRTSKGATSASVDRNEEAMIMLNGLVAEYIKKLGLVEATEEFLKRALKLTNQIGPIPDDAAHSPALEVEQIISSRDAPKPIEAQVIHKGSVLQFVPIPEVTPIDLTITSLPA